MNKTDEIKHIIEEREKETALRDAAPELLAALELFLVWFESDKPNMRPVLIEAASRARTLIKRLK